jgi:hypothetical protein
MYDDPTDRPPQTESSKIVTTTTVALSPGLSALLKTEASDDRAVREIVGSSVMLAEARQALPVLKARATAPASREVIMETIARRFSLFTQPPRSESEWTAWWGDYFEALEGITAGAVEAAMAAWVKLPDSEFMPKPGKLRELAQMTPNRDVKAYTRARAAVDYEPQRQIPVTPLSAIIGGDFRPKAPPAPEPERDRKARVDSMLAEYRAQHAAMKADRPASAMKPTPVPTNEHGVSLAMMALREKQEGRT